MEYHGFVIQRQCGFAETHVGSLHPQQLANPFQRVKSQRPFRVLPEGEDAEYAHAGDPQRIPKSAADRPVSGKAMGSVGIALECLQPFPRQASMDNLRLVILEVDFPTAGIRLRNALLQSMIDQQVWAGTGEHDRICEGTKDAKRECCGMIRSEDERLFQADA